VGTWGGKRAGAGRKPGSGNNKRAIAARSRHRAQSIEAVIDAKARALRWLASHEDEVLDRLLASDDERVVLTLWQTLRAYASGTPIKHTAIEVSMTPEAVLRQIQAEREARRRTAIPAAVAMLPEGSPDRLNPGTPWAQY